MPRPTTAAPPFAGFASPNFTQVPDELFDVLLPQLSDAELRVLLYIIRRTFGFKREADRISLSQMVSGITTRDGHVLDRGTGLAKATVARGLKGLREKGVIEAHRNSSRSRGDEPTTYRLRFKASTSDQLTPLDHVSQRRDTPPVSLTRHPLSQPRDTQQTASKNTDFDDSKVKTLVDKTEVEALTPHQSRLQPDQRGSGMDLEPVARVMRRRTPTKREGEDALAISATIERLAAELGDQAALTSSWTRALRLFAASGLSQERFIDLLYQARGEVKDRRAHPGKAPVPRKQMAYFFAVVEDRLGVHARRRTASEAAHG